MTNPAQYPTEVYASLYTDESGAVVGLDEVQLLDPVPTPRIPILVAQLDRDDAYLAYQCGLVLAAWGVREGVQHLQRLVEIRIDSMVTLEPHRLWGEDNVYDVIADVLGVAVLSGYNRTEIVAIVREILELYGECYFESKLKRVLTDLDEQSLLPDTARAMQAALQHERYYQASQLLPVLAKYDKAYALAQLVTFQTLSAKDERIPYNLEEVRALTA